MPGHAIDTGRTWRDLPAAPPTDPVAARPVSASPPSPPAPPKPTRWPWVLAAVGIVLVGISVGALLANRSSTDPPPDEPTLIPLPELIIPPLPETTVPGNTNAPGDPGDRPGQFFFEFDGLISVDPPPIGYRVVSNSLQVSPDRVEQQLTLEGPDGEVRIEARAQRSPGALPDGQRVDLRGTTGVLLEFEGRFRLAWIEGERVEVVVEAPAGSDSRAILELAESLSVTP